jgi:deazaflavin-dependent oxidoreductase (nitroreductase family)
MQTIPNTTIEPMGDAPMTGQGSATASPAPSNAAEGLGAGPIAKAFIRLNVYIYSKPPKKIQTKISKGFLHVHIWLYQRSRGRIAGQMGNLDALLLHTLGRRSGKERVVPIGYLFEEGHFYAVAVPGHFDVPGGGPKGRHPAWYLNLTATPEATINIGREQIEVVAETLGGPERDRIWARYAKVLPFINEFQKRASRELPVVKFTPKDMLPSM